MSDYPTLTPRVIGETEKTLNAFLGRLLAGTGVAEPQWVILSVAITGGGSITQQQAAFALKITEPQARDQLDQLIAAGYLTDGNSAWPPRAACSASSPSGQTPSSPAARRSSTAG